MHAFKLHKPHNNRFLSVLTSDGQYPKMTGDIAYAEAIEQATNNTRHNNPPITLLGRAEDERNENAIYGKIIERCHEAKPTLHVMLNFDTTTHGHTVEGLKQFKKETGARIVLTSIEFHMYGNKHKGKGFEEKTCPYFKVADEIIFLDNYDKRAATQAYEAFAPTDKKTIRRLKHAHVIHVPATAKLAHSPLTERAGNDIAFFGMMRPTKGIEHVLELAQIMKEHDSEDRVVMIASTNRKSDNNPDLAQTELAKVIGKVYPACAQGEGAGTIAGCESYDELVNLADTLIEKDEGRALPVKLHLNKPAELYPVMLATSKSMVALDHHGASLRNTAKSSALAAGFRLYTTSTAITPECLKLDGEFAQAMTLLKPNIPNTSLAAQIWEHHRAHGRQPKRDETIEGIQRDLVHKHLTPAVVAHKHSELYKGNLLQQVL